MLKYLEGSVLMSAIYCEMCSPPPPIQKEDWINRYVIKYGKILMTDSMWWIYGYSPLYSFNFSVRLKFFIKNFEGGKNIVTVISTD